jgi:mannose-6-phosphate isomerase
LIRRKRLSAPAHRPAFFETVFWVHEFRAGVRLSLRDRREIPSCKACHADLGENTAAEKLLASSRAVFLLLKLLGPVQMALYPLRFEPLYQYRLWGGRRLSNLLSAALPADGPIGEAWLLSDRDDHSSVVANGPLRGETLGRLRTRWPEQLLGKGAGRLRRFPLLLKYLDVHAALSVQVHPSDRQTAYLPAGESGKTEAWVVLQSGADSRIYAGLVPNTTAETMRAAIAKGTVVDELASFSPKMGDGIFIPAGTVHSLRDVVVFEVQENSDVTFRLYDWNHIDAKTHEPRPLQVEQAMACVDFSQGAIGPVAPKLEEATSVLRERLFDCEHFRLWRLRSESPFTVGLTGTPRVLVCIDGKGGVKHEGTDWPCVKGDVMLLPATVGACLCEPHGSMSLLEIALPEAE